MKHGVVWTRTAWELFEELPRRNQGEILEKLLALSFLPHMYPVRTKGRRFRRHRWFSPGNWLVYYRGQHGLHPRALARAHPLMVMMGNSTDIFSTD